MPEETAGPYPADGSTASNAGYSAIVRNRYARTFATDNVFSDGTALEIATLQANTGGGCTTSITISIAACPWLDSPWYVPSPTA